MNRGFFVGFGLTVWRILRCNPFCAGGFDPVPPKKIPKYRRDRREEPEASDNDTPSVKDTDKK